MMDDRTRRLGQHTMRTAPAWAIQALGPVPTDPADHQDWERKAASIAAYREIYGYDHPGDPIGPEPSHQAPDQRAAWHQAFAAFSPASQPDIRAMPDGQLWFLRDSYAAQTAWAPRHVGKELRLSRLGAFDAALGAIRADAEADATRKTGDHDRAARHEHLAGSYRAMRDHYQQQEQALALTMTDRQEWEQATDGSRRMAIAADTELRRRHPARNYPPLRSAEPRPSSQARRDGLTLTAGEQIPEPAQWIKDLAAQRRAFADRLASHQSLMVPAEDPDYGDLGPAFPPWRAPARQPILQPPRPEIQPSERTLERAADREPDWEAAD
jgi:hypothetical protein